MTKGIDRSSPPSSATSVCPTQAMPRKDGEEQDRLEVARRGKPSIVKELIDEQAGQDDQADEGAAAVRRRRSLTLKAKTRIASRTRKAMRLRIVRKAVTEQ